MFEDRFVIFPFVKGFEIVLAHNQRKLVLRIFVLQMRQSIDGIIGLWQFKFKIRRLDLGVIFCGEENQLQTLVIVEQGVFLLERIVRRDHHPDLIESCVFGHVVGDNQVTGVDGVERAEIKSDFHC